ncbi:MAG: hypothetical protein H7X79_04245 [Sporomusaceae bacterium]|nr:hypothetical protein [Sporomusaceae bacterium]
MAMIVTLLIGILTALFVYNDAKGRGHGEITARLWSAGSMIMPYLILPVYLLIGRKAKQQNRQSQYDNSDVIDIEATIVEETIDCSMCGRKIKEDFVVCPYCQAPTGSQRKEN